MLERTVGILMAVLLSCSLANGESPLLQRYVENGIENNLGLLRETLALQKQQAAMTEARGLFFPEVTLLANYTRAEGGRTIDFPVGDLFNPIHATLNQLTQSAAFPPNLANQEIQLLPDDFHETKLQIILPLFHSDIYFNYRAQRDLVNVQAAQREAFVDELTLEIKSGYYQYLQSEALLRIHRETMAVLQELRRVNERLVAAQKATREVISIADYEISKLEQEIAGALKRRNLARAYFNALLNRELGEDIGIDSTLVKGPLTMAVAEARTTALRNRPELQQLQAAISTNERLIGMRRAEFLPKVFAAGEIGYQGFEYKFDDTQDFWLVRVGLEWNLFNGARSLSRIQQASIEAKRLQAQHYELEKQIQLQVIDAYYGVEAAQLAVTAAMKGEQAARESFRIIKRKYQEGQALLVEFLDARTRSTTSRISLAITRYALLIEQAKLERAVGM